MKKKQNSFDFLQFCIDNGIRYNLEGKNASPGWMQTKCCFCNDESNHLGFNFKTSSFSCWKCGKHDSWDVIQILLGIPRSAVGKIFFEYTKKQVVIKHEKNKLKKYSFSYPDGTGTLSKDQITYLKSRNMDQATASFWQLQGTQKLGYLGTFNYSFRIIVPIMNLAGKPVSFQAADYKRTSDIKYKACHESFEIIHHKHTLYGLNAVPNFDRIIITEGVSDVWNIGAGSCCTFGTKYTIQQLDLLARFKQRYLMFDNDEAGNTASDSLLCDLSVYDGENFIVEYDATDPGSLNKKEALQIKNEVFKWN